MRDGSILSSAIEIGLTLLINEIAALLKEIVLVLDDFHVIGDSNMLKVATNFLKHLPQNLHQVVATRSEPAMDLASLLAKGRMVELGQTICGLPAKRSGYFFISRWACSFRQKLY
ncbi:MAG TPA: hypothetical protein VMS73_01870 [Anaerolineaceae bacterium]|nr:hypothetical protein [Anaerolineaceae bacterium]